MRAALFEKDYVVFYCPGCGNSHGLTVNGRKNGSGATWIWNGSLELPTFSPSIHCEPGNPRYHCHSFVREGKIQFLSDCFHDLAGQTIDLPEWED